LAGATAWKADAATPIGVSNLPSLVHSSSPIETARWVCGPRGCARVHSWRGSSWAWGGGPGWRRSHWAGSPGWRRSHWAGSPGWRRSRWAMAGGSSCWWRSGVRVCRHWGGLGKKKRPQEARFPGTASFEQYPKLTILTLDSRRSTPR
jgi:hypothetical protein